METKNDHSRKIGVATATIISMNAMIGAGIFTAPATMAFHVGPAGILAYLFVIIAVWFMATSLARLAELYPYEGSFYTYVKQWGGHTVGLIAAFSYLTGLVIAMGLLSQSAGAYLQIFFPQFSILGLGLFTLGCIFVLNICGIALSQAGQYILIGTTVFPLLAITALCLTHFDFAHLTPFAPYGFGNVFKATRIVIFGFLGFEAATSLFSMMQSPQQNVPRALAYSIALVGILYLLFVGSIIVSVPLSLFTNPEMPLSTILQQVFPTHPWLILCIHLSILSAMIGTIHSMLWSSAALLTSLAKKIDFLPTLHWNAINKHRCAVSILTLFIAYTCCMFTNLDLYFSYTAAFIVGAFILSMFTLLTLPNEWKSGKNIGTLIGIVTAGAILYFSLERILTFTI